MTSPAHRTRRQRHPAQGLARIVVLALFLLGQGYGVVHHSVVEHHVCEVDGQLAHGGAHEHAAAVTTSADSAPLEFEEPLALALADHGHVHDGSAEHGHADHEHAVREDDAPEEPLFTAVESEHGHDHCSVPTTRDKRKFLAIGPSTHWVPFQAAAWVSGDHSQTVVRAIPVFRLAPKQSPPSAA